MVILFRRTAVLQVLMNGRLVGIMNGRLVGIMNGRLVGRLHSSARGVLSFLYDQSWLDFAGRRPISLSLPLTGREYVDLSVENFFDNLLPDSLVIRSRLQARVGAESGRCFDLLARIGRDCIGALQLLPEDESVAVRSVHAQPLSEEEIADILKNYQTMPLGIHLEADFRLSLAGARRRPPCCIMAVAGAGLPGQRRPAIYSNCLSGNSAGAAST